MLLLYCNVPVAEGGNVVILKSEKDITGAPLFVRAISAAATHAFAVVSYLSTCPLLGEVIITSTKSFK